MLVFVHPLPDTLTHNQVLSQTRPFAEASNIYYLYSKVCQQGLRPSLDQLPADTPASIITMMQQCWDGDRTKRISAAQCLSVIAEELDICEEEDARRGFVALENPLGKTCMQRAPELQAMMQRMFMELSDVKAAVREGAKDVKDVKKGQEVLLSGQQEVLQGIRELSEQLSRALDGLGQSLEAVRAAAVRDTRAEGGFAALGRALEAHREAAQRHGDGYDPDGSLLARAVDAATADLDPELASSLVRCMTDVMAGAGGGRQSLTGGYQSPGGSRQSITGSQQPSKGDKLDALVSVVTEMREEIRSLRELNNEQTKLLRIIEGRGNRVPQTFIIVPDVEEYDTVGATAATGSMLTATARAIKRSILRQPLVQQLIGLVWERSRLLFICPVTGKAVACGPPRPPHNGKGYLIHVPKAWVKQMVPVLQWGMAFLKAGLASQGVVLPGIDFMPALADERLRQVVESMSAELDLDADMSWAHLGEHTKDFVEAEADVGAVVVKDAGREKLKQAGREVFGPGNKQPSDKTKSLAMVLRFLAEAEGAGDVATMPEWKPQFVGLELATCRRTQATMWVSAEGRERFEELGEEALLASR